MNTEYKDQNFYNRADTIRNLTAHALGGMLANPEWLAFAKSEACKGGNGDVATNYAKIAVQYAETTADLLEKTISKYK